MRKTQILMNEPVYFGLSILDLSATIMYEFWYDYDDYVKPKYAIVKMQNVVIRIQTASLFM